MLSRRVLLEKERDELKEQTLETLEGGQDRRGHRQEHHRVRRVHRPRRHRRPAPHHRHELGPRQPPARAVPGRRRGHASRSSSSTPRPSASRSASSRSAKIRGTTPQEAYPPGTVVRGKVVSLTDYGAFVELEQGIEGLVHVSEMTLDQAGQAPVEGGRGRRQASRRSCSTSTPTQKRICARHEAARAEPVDARSPRSTRRARSSRARSATSPTSASSSEIEEGIDGLVHISDMTWTQRVKHPSELYQKGDEVEAVVLNIDIDGENEGLARHQAAGRRSVGSHPVRLPGRQDRRRPRSSRSSTSAPSSSSRRASRASSTSREISRGARRGSAHGAQAGPGR